jgi:hypothetical protein
MKIAAFKQEIILKGQALFRAISPLFLQKKLIIPFFLVLIVLWQKPQLALQFKSHSGPLGYGQVYEAIIDVHGGRPFGISNLFVELSFPSDLIEIKIMSKGYVSAVIRNIHCQNPIVVKRKLKPVEFGDYADPSMKVCIELLWKDCEADIKLYQQCSGGS